ncbi:MAG: hypothetical protein ACRDXB_14765, partial [Actinomycetes bacterium]
MDASRGIRGQIACERHRRELLRVDQAWSRHPVDQLTDRFRDDRAGPIQALGQPAHSQQIGQVRGIAFDPDSPIADTRSRQLAVAVSGMPGSAASGQLSEQLPGPQFVFCRSRGGLRVD